MTYSSQELNFQNFQNYEKFSEIFSENSSKFSTNFDDFSAISVFSPITLFYRILYSILVFYSVFNHEVRPAASARASAPRMGLALPLPVLGWINTDFRS